MAKATLELLDGTIVTIEGTVQEVDKLLQIYNKPGKGEQKSKDSSTNTKTEKKVQSTTLSKDTFNLMDIVNKIKECDEAEAIEKQILDRTSEVNRVLLPLYVIHEHFKNSKGLTTTEIDKVTTELGIRVSRQNALRAVKFSGSRYVIGDKPRKRGTPSRYKLNRRGLIYMKSVITSSSNEEQN
jgi:hypothetical protein